MNKKYLLPALGLTVATTAAAVDSTKVMAEDANFYPPIVEAIAEKFNLSEEDVKNVFDEEREERSQFIMHDREEGLNQAVEDGVITDAQRQAILDRESQMWEERERAREENRIWFEEQGIDESALMPYLNFGRGPEHGPRDLSN